MDEVELHKQVARGQDAKAVLDHPIVGEALLHMRQQLYSDYLNTAPDQAEQRDELWRQQMAVTWFTNFLYGLAYDGESAAKKLEQVAEDQKRQMFLQRRVN